MELGRLELWDRPGSCPGSDHSKSRGLDFPRLQVWVLTAPPTAGLMEALGEEWRAGLSARPGISAITAVADTGYRLLLPSALGRWSGWLLAAGPAHTTPCGLWDPGLPQAVGTGPLSGPSLAASTEGVSGNKSPSFLI